MVSVAHNNPSPFEITEGIKTVEGNIDLKMATATIADVVAGKTFYAGTSELKTGTNRSGDLYNLRFYNDSTAEELTTPDDIVDIPAYLFANIQTSTQIKLSSNAEKIGDYCFYQSTLGGFSFNNTTKLTSLGHNAFGNSDISINFSMLPDSLVTIGDYPFYNATPTNEGYVKIPKNATNLGLYALSANKYCEVPDGINWNDNQLFDMIPQFCFYYQAFHGEFRVPSHIHTIKNSAFFDAKFTKFVIPSTVTYLENNFYCIAPDFANKISKLDMIFESVTPPTFKSTPFYYLNRLSTDQLSIYVPDESLSAYTAVSQLSSYVKYIKPMSQLPE